jgi:hypothetical protein
MMRCRRALGGEALSPAMSSRLSLASDATAGFEPVFRFGEDRD